MKTPLILSRRSLIRSAAITVAAAAGGCTALGETTGSLAPGGAAAGAEAGAGMRPTGPSVLVVTTRQPVDKAENAPWFGDRRSGATRVVRAELEPKDTSMIGRAPSFVGFGDSITRISPIGEGDPVAALTQAVAGRDLLIYVHGYNTSFETAVITAAKLAQGIGFKGAVLTFSWPSRGELLDYGYDRESALWSRDAFQDVLESLARAPMGGKVNIVAHSMGTLLTIEVLRQLWQTSGTGDVAARFGAIVLASPDMDIDVFAASLPRLGPLATHLTIITSQDDRALAISGKLAGGVSRVGAADRERLEPLGVKIVDASGYGWGVGHDLFVSNADVRAVVKRAVERGGAA